MSGVIESPEYGETRAALREDPAIKAMAADVPPSALGELLHESGTPRHSFMGHALDEYKRRCEAEGRKPLDTHIGGPAEVIASLVRERAA